MSYPRATSHNALLIIRGIAILSVLWFHIVPLNVPGLLLIDGMSAVWVLLILSGYLMGKKWRTNTYVPNAVSIKTFYTDRLAKIIPAYYLIILITFVYFQLPFDKNLIIKLLTFQAATISLPQALDNLWYVSIAIQCYLLFPFLWVFIQFMYHQSRLLMLMIALLFPLISMPYRMYVYAKTLPADMSVWTALFHKNIFVILDMFIMGMLLNYIVVYIQQKQLLRACEPWIKSLSVIAFVAMTLLSAHTLYRFHVDFTHTAFFYATMLPGIIMTITGLCIVVFEYENHTKPAATIHPLTLLTWIGTLSYELYLVHPPIVMASLANPTTSLRCSANCTVSIFLYQYGVLVTLSVLAAYTLKNLREYMNTLFTTHAQKT